MANSTETSEQLAARGLKWKCSECQYPNKRYSVYCDNCGKQRWWQLGFSLRDTRIMAEKLIRIQDAEPTSEDVAEGIPA